MSIFSNVYEIRLRESCGATDTELTYIKSIIQLKWRYNDLPRTLNQQPSEILDSWLFQGDWRHANDLVTLDSFSISHVINVADGSSLDQSRKILNIPSRDSLSVDLLKSFNETNTFLDECHQQNGRALVHCNRGVSRSSTIILAYLMHCQKWTLLQAFEYLLTKRPQASPNKVLLLQLIRYENELIRRNDEN